MIPSLFFYSRLGRWINSLQPSVHISIRRGRVLLGNHLMEQTLVTYFASSESHFTITAVREKKINFQKGYCLFVS